MKNMKPICIGAVVLGAALAALQTDTVAQYVERARYVMTGTNNVVNSHADLTLPTGESLAAAHAAGTGAIARLDIAEPLLATAVQLGSSPSFSNLTVTGTASLPGPLTVDSLTVSNLVANVIRDSLGNDWRDLRQWQMVLLGAHLSVVNMTYTTNAEGTEGLGNIMTLRRTAGASGSFNVRVPVRTGTTGVVARISQMVSTNAVAGQTQQIRMLAAAMDPSGADNLGDSGANFTQTLSGGKQSWIAEIYCPMHASVTNATHLRLLVTVPGTGAGANTNASWVTSMEYRLLP